MKKVAITGGLTAGKSTVCQILQDLGAYVVSSDEIVHYLLSSDPTTIQTITEHLGSDLFTNHTLDRKKIAKLVFSEPTKLRLLEKILHPQVFGQIRHRYEQVKNEHRYFAFVAEVPLLYEADLHRWFDLTIAITADEKHRYNRSADKEAFLERLEKQLPQEHKAARADYEIKNNGTLKELENQVRHFKEKYFR